MSTVHVSRSASLVQVAATRPQVAIGTPSIVSAAYVPFTPAGSIAATNVQTAIEELDASLSLPSLVAGDMLYATGVGATARLVLGTAGRVMVAGASAPAWSDDRLSYSAGVVTLGNNTNAGGYVVNGPSGGVRSWCVIQSAGLTAWGLFVRDATDDLRIRAYDNAGAAIDYPLTIARTAGGAITLARSLVGTSLAASSWGVFGAADRLASESGRFAGGTMGTPSATDVLLAAGKVYAGSTAASTSGVTGSIISAGGIAANASSYFLSISSSYACQFINTNAGTAPGLYISAGRTTDLALAVDDAAGAALMRLNGNGLLTVNKTGGGISVLGTGATSIQTAGSLRALGNSTKVGDGANTPVLTSTLHVDRATTNAAVITLQNATYELAFGCTTATFFGSRSATDLYIQRAGSNMLTITSTAVDLTAGVVYKINGTQVVGPRSTGWTAQTATASKADLGATPTVGALSSFCRSLYDALAAHGLIGT